MLPTPTRVSETVAERVWRTYETRTCVLGIAIGTACDDSCIDARCLDSEWPGEKGMPALHTRATPCRPVRLCLCTQRDCNNQQQLERALYARIAAVCW